MAGFFTLTALTAAVAYDARIIGVMGAAVFFGLLGLYEVGRRWLRARRRKAWAAQQRDIAALKRMSWQEFEHYTAAVFARAGWAVTVTGGGGADSGVDLMLTRRGVRVVVQCKHYRARVGAPVLRDAVGAAAALNAHGVYVVALGGFTKAAHGYAAKMRKRVRLVDGPELLAFMNR